MKTITIDSYTAAWDSAMRPKCPTVGTRVKVPNTHSADGREWDAFRRVLRAEGRDLDFVRASSRYDWSVVVEKK